MLAFFPGSMLNQMHSDLGIQSIQNKPIPL
jgi:hypothetical protein